MLQFMVYVSGGLTTGGMSFDENKAEFSRVCEQLSVNGIKAYNPALVVIPEGTQEDYMQYYEGCVLPMCHAIYMRRGWEKSTGAQREHSWALSHSLPIYYEERR